MRSHGKFHHWLHWDCRKLDWFIVAPNTPFEAATDVLPAILHATKHVVLSNLRTCPVMNDSIVRAIAATFGMTLGTTGPDAPPATEWDATDKHRALLLIPRE